MKIHFKFCSIRFWIGLIAACISFIISYSIGGSIPKCMILSATFVVVSLFKISVGNVKKCAVGKYPKSEKLGSAGQAACCACTHSRYFTGGSPSGLRV